MLLCWLLVISREKFASYLFNYLIMGFLKVTGSQEKENTLVLAANTSCARKYPSALHVPLSAENDKNVHGDEHREALCVGLLQFFLFGRIYALL